MSSHHIIIFPKTNYSFLILSPHISLINSVDCPYVTFARNYLNFNPNKIVESQSQESSQMEAFFAFFVTEAGRREEEKRKKI